MNWTIQAELVRAAFRRATALAMKALPAGPIGSGDAVSALWDDVHSQPCPAPAQVVLLLPLFTFCYCMYVWERSELVPIRPAEGEELPVNMLGARPLREAKFLETLERRLSGAASASVSKASF